ncbi:MAG: suppressor of fused domain protein [Oscillospiraceae bacterium]|nr:suppressor of fused domain protein [Oscillospiraceae bacterium]
MFTLNNKDIMLERREAVYKARCGLADTLDVLGLMLTLPVKDKAERVYCYCSLRGKNVLFVAFYTVGDKAVLFADDINKAEMMELNMAVMSQLVYLKSQYEDCDQLMPSELFLEFDPVTREAHVLAGMEYFSDPNVVNIRALTWFKEHGGKLPRSSELAMKTRFRAQTAAAQNPSGNAQLIDLETLEISRKYITGEIEDPAITDPPTGWDAIRSAFNKAYPNTPDPMSFELPNYATEAYEENFENGFETGEQFISYVDKIGTDYGWVDIYDGGDSWHFVSCSFSDMGPAQEDEEKDSWAEYTLRLKKNKDEDKDNLEINNTLGVFRNFIGCVYDEGALIPAYHYVHTGQDFGMDVDEKSDKVAFIVVPDKRLKPVEGPHGLISFLEIVAISKNELQALIDKEMDVEILYKKMGTDITDYNRKSAI